MEQLTALLDKLKTKTTTIAINISSRSVLEVIEFNKEGKIENYATVPIQYNAFTKELENIVDFESALKRTYSELGISLSSKTYISIPTFIIENEIIPASVAEDDESIKTYLTSAAEKNYIFKKYDPAISYYKQSSNDDNTDSIPITYTALRQDEYSKLIGVFESLGMKIVAVDSSYSSLINGVIATQRVNPNILNNNDTWNIINITSNSFMIFAMKGKNLNAVYEEPLAVKSFSEEEIYQVITNSLDLVMDKYPANQVIVVSQSDNVSAEYLSGILNTDAAKAYIEDNKYRKQLVELGYNITQSNKTKISLEAVGISHWAFNEDGFKFNFFASPTAVASNITVPDSITVGDTELTPAKIQIFSYVYGIIILIIGLIAFLGCNAIENTYTTTQTELASQIKELEAQTANKPQQTGITEAEFLQKNYNENVDFKKSYSAIAREIPDMLWIEEVQLGSNSNLYMSGRSYRMDDILNYYDSLSKLGKFPNLKISTLKISNDDISSLIKSDLEQETTYEFAFGNSFYVDPNAVVETKADDADKKKKQESSVPLPPGASQQKEEPPADNAIAPAPTAIPKEDK